MVQGNLCVNLNNTSDYPPNPVKIICVCSSGLDAKFCTVITVWSTGFL